MAIYTVCTLIDQPPQLVVAPTITITTVSINWTLDGVIPPTPTTPRLITAPKTPH